MRFSTNRQIPFTIKYGLLVGGPKFSMLWLLFCSSLVLSMLVVMNVDMSFLRSSKTMQTVTGTVVSSAKTSLSIGGVPVYKVQYMFYTEDEDLFEGTSYSSGNIFQTGKMISIEYPEGRLYDSKIKGARRKILGPGILVFMLFPLVVLIVLILMVKKSMYVLMLLRNGRRAKGKFISKVSLGNKEYKLPVYDVTIGFEGRLGEKLEVIKTTMKPQAYENGALNILYIEQEPSKAVVLDIVAPFIVLNEVDRVEPVPFSRYISYIFYPLLTVAIIGVFFLRKL